MAESRTVSPGPTRVAIAGFGNVGRALASMVAQGHPGVDEVVITGVSDPRFGTVVDENGLDPDALLAQSEKGGFADALRVDPGQGVYSMVDSKAADVLVELTFTDLETGEPATSHVRRAIARGMHVSTTNKGPIALHYDSLSAEAEAAGVVLAAEGTVMSGTPAVATAERVAAAGFKGLAGILNGTTNFIVTEMRGGQSYEEALADAQDRGYAEADPSGDVEGLDAAAKLTILSRIVTGEAIPVSEVDRTSLATLSGDQVIEAASNGGCWRYVARIAPSQSGYRASVGPELLPSSHPLASIDGALNAVSFETESLGQVTLVGPGAGRAETAYAVVSDLHQIRARSQH